MMNKGKILVVDDNTGIRSALSVLLPKHFDKVELLSSPKDIHAMMRGFSPDVILTPTRGMKGCFGFRR